MPIKTEPERDTLLQAAVIETRPDKMQFIMSVESCTRIRFALPKLKCEIVNLKRPAAADEAIVFIAIFVGIVSTVISTISYVEALLKKSHPAQRRSPPIIEIAGSCKL